MLLFCFGSCDFSNDAELLKDDVASTKGPSILKSMDKSGKITESPIIHSTIISNANAKVTPYKASGHMDWFPFDSESTWKKSLIAIGTETTGKGNVEISSTAWGDVHGTVLCIYAEETEAVVAMWITNEKEIGHEVYEMGRIVWFRLIDNGEGSNYPPDQHYNTVYYTTETFATEEDAQLHIMGITCKDLFLNYNWGYPGEIYEGNFQVKNGGPATPPPSEEN